MKSSKHVCIAILYIVISSGCEKALNLDSPGAEPKEIFDELWNVIDQRYALFSVKNIDWDSAYKANVAAVKNNTTEAELFKISSKLLESLRDGHVSLITPDRVYTYENFYSGFPINFNLKNILAFYLKDQYIKLGPILYKVVNNIAYMYYGTFRENITDEALDLFFTAIAGTKGLIIDVRSNSGGNLSNAEKIYSRLIAERKLVKYELHKKGIGKNDFYQEEPNFISPSGSNFYNKQIVILTNRTCFSACNDFVLYMSQLPNVTIVGDQTGGGGAIPANYLLSNGWMLQYSSSMTLSPEHKSVEGGILPDLNIIILPIQESQGYDPIIEKAYEMLK